MNKLLNTPNDIIINAYDILDSYYYELLLSDFYFFKISFIFVFKSSNLFLKLLFLIKQNKTNRVQIETEKFLQNFCIDNT